MFTSHTDGIHCYQNYEAEDRRIFFLSLSTEHIDWNRMACGLSKIVSVMPLKRFSPGRYVNSVTVLSRIWCSSTNRMEVDRISTEQDNDSLRPPKW